MTTVFHEFAVLAADCIEALAVTIMVACITLGTARWIFHISTDIASAYSRYREMLGKSLLLGLELLVAADIIRTVLLELTLSNMLTLGALVVVRTGLGWALTVEVEGHWPWQDSAPGKAGDT